MKSAVSKYFFVFNFFLLVSFLLTFSFLTTTRAQSLPVPLKIEPQKILGFKQLLPTPALYPVSLNTYIFPDISAVSGLVMDIDSGVVLYEKNANLQVYPASTTKIMTGLVTLENYPLSQYLRVNSGKVDGTVVNLVEGEELTVENLLYGLLVASGNDAAQVLAENYYGGVLGFVSAMNEKARQLGLKNTHFTNPMGYDQDGHLTTAGDLARLAVYALKNKEFSRIVSTANAQIADSDGKNYHLLKNTNLLVGKIDGVKGVKTGLTQKAGECLITLVERDNRRILVVLLGSGDRFGETEKIIDWTFNNFSWRLIRPANFL